MFNYLYVITAILVLNTGFISAKSQEMSPSLSQTVVLERTKEIDQILLLVQKRLVLSHEIAKSKWNSNENISLSPDALYMKQIAKLASAYGLNKEWTQTFFKSQAEAGKMLQQRDFENWTEEKSGEFEGVPNYHTQIKPYLDRLTKEILQSIVISSPYLAEDNMSEFISQKPISSRPEDYIPEDVWLKAIEPLYNFTP